VLVLVCNGSETTDLSTEWLEVLTDATYVLTYRDALICWPFFSYPSWTVPPNPFVGHSPFSFYTKPELFTSAYMLYVYVLLRHRRLVLA